MSALSFVPSAATLSSSPHLVSTPRHEFLYAGSHGPQTETNGIFMNACRIAPLLGAASLLAPRGLKKRFLRRVVQCKAEEETAAAEEETAAAKEVVPEKEFDVTMEVGVCEPWGKPGEYVWDPMGETKDMDESKFRWYRQAEIKHGRVAMLAIAGLLNQGLWRFGAVELASFDGGLGLVPSDFGDVNNGVAAVGSGAGPYLGLVVILAGILELRLSDDGKEPGNFDDPVGILSASGGVGAYDTTWRNMEINNGRLAMFGIIGALTAEYVTGMDTYAQWEAAASAFKD